LMQQQGLILTYAINNPGRETIPSTVAFLVVDKTELEESYGLDLSNYQFKYWTVRDEANNPVPYTFIYKDPEKHRYILAVRVTNIPAASKKLVKVIVDNEALATPEEPSNVFVVITNDYPLAILGGVYDPENKLIVPSRLQMIDGSAARRYTIYYGWVTVYKGLDWSKLTHVVLSDCSPLYKCDEKRLEYMQNVVTKQTKVFSYLPIGSRFEPSDEFLRTVMAEIDFIKDTVQASGVFFDEVDVHYWKSEPTPDDINFFESFIKEITDYAKHRGLESIINGTRAFAKYGDMYMWESFALSFTGDPTSPTYTVVDIFAKMEGEDDPYTWINNLAKRDYLVRNGELQKTIAHGYAEPSDLAKAEYMALMGIALGLLSTNLSPADHQKISFGQLAKIYATMTKIGLPTAPVKIDPDYKMISFVTKFAEVNINVGDGTVSINPSDIGLNQPKYTEQGFANYNIDPANFSIDGYPYNIPFDYMSYWNVEKQGDRLVATGPNAHVIVPFGTPDQLDILFVRASTDNIAIKFQWSKDVPSYDDPNWTPVRIAPPYSENGIYHLNAYIFAKNPEDGSQLFIMVEIPEGEYVDRILGRTIYGTSPPIAEYQDIVDLRAVIEDNILKVTLVVNDKTGTPNNNVIYRLFIDVDDDPNTGFKGADWMMEWEHGADIMLVLDTGWDANNWIAFKWTGTNNRDISGFTDEVMRIPVKASTDGTFTYFEIDIPLIFLPGLTLDYRSKTPVKILAITEEKNNWTVDFHPEIYTVDWIPQVPKPSPYMIVLSPKVYLSRTSQYSVLPLVRLAKSGYKVVEPGKNYEAYIKLVNTDPLEDYEYAKPPVQVGGEHVVAHITLDLENMMLAYNDTPVVEGIAFYEYYPHSVELVEAEATVKKLVAEIMGKTELKPLSR